MTDKTEQPKTVYWADQHISDLRLSKTREDWLEAQKRALEGPPGAVARLDVDGTDTIICREAYK